jgi:hypothetical protein
LGSAAPGKYGAGSGGAFNGGTAANPSAGVIVLTYTPAAPSFIAAANKIPLQAVTRASYW